MAQPGQKAGGRIECLEGPVLSGPDSDGEGGTEDPERERGCEQEETGIDGFTR